MSDTDDAVNGARQLGDVGQWPETPTPRAIAQTYSPDATEQWARVAIEKAALELGQQLPGRSEYAAPGAPTDTLAGYVLDTDAHAYDLWLELGAIVGDTNSTEIVQAAADAGNTRAQAVLAFAASVDKLLGLA